jgi:hypothetical protein
MRIKHYVAVIGLREAAATSRVYGRTWCRQGFIEILWQLGKTEVAKVTGSGESSDKIPPFQSTLGIIIRRPTVRI